MTCKLYIGCVSKNTIDSVVEYSLDYNTYIGLIPSRRQVDYDGGYVSFTNSTLRNYINSKKANVIFERDHGGPNQGKYIDDGIVSLMDDCKHYDIIHIDPWKKYNNFNDGLLCTKSLIEKCLNQNYSGKFEIATEQSIKEFTSKELDILIYECKEYPIEYVVIQSGTSLKENINTGIYDKNKLLDFIKIVKKYGLKSKEHNGDYISTELIKEKFNLGLDAINIAPEFGLIETNCYLNELRNNKILVDKFYNICYDSGQWKKWVGKDFDINNKEKLIKICGHYVLENDIFKHEIKDKIKNIDYIIKSQMKQKISDILI